MRQKLNLLWDKFTTPVTPLPSPRACEPGPGSVVKQDSTNLAGITANGLVIPSKNTWDDPCVLFRDSSGNSFARSLRPYCHIKVTITTPSWLSLGWAQDSFSYLSQRGAMLIFDPPKSRVLLRVDNVTGGEANDENVAMLRAGSYEFASQLLPDGGCAFWAKGGMFGTSWRFIGWTRTYTTTPLGMQINHFAHNATYREVLIRKKALPLVSYAFVNVGTNVGGVYKLSQLLFDWGTWTAAPRFSSPNLETVSGWETFSGTSTLNAPWSLQEGSRLLVYYNSNPTPGSQIGLAYTDDEGANWTRAPGNPLFPADDVVGSPNRYGTHFACVWKNEASWYALTSGWSSNDAATSECFVILWKASSYLGPWTKASVAGRVDSTIFDLPIGKKRTLPGAVTFVGDVGYLFYQVADSGSFPDNGECWVATFDRLTPENGFTILGKAFGNRNNVQTPSAVPTSGATTVTVPTPSAFVVGETVCIFDVTGNYQTSTVTAVGATTITIEPPSLYNFAESVKVQSLDRSVVPRSVWKEGDKWHALCTYYQHGVLDNNAFGETTGRLIGTSPLNWEKLLSNGQITLFPQAGRMPGETEGYIGRVLENTNLTLDPLTLSPVRFTLK